LRPMNRCVQILLMGQAELQSICSSHVICRPARLGGWPAGVLVLVGIQPQGQACVLKSGVALLSMLQVNIIYTACHASPDPGELVNMQLCQVWRMWHKHIRSWTAPTHVALEF
jgi:hypothetical protein